MCVHACANSLQKGLIVVVVIVVVVTASVVGSFVNLLTIFQNLGQTNKHTHGGVYRVAPQLTTTRVIIKPSFLTLLPARWACFSGLGTWLYEVAVATTPSVFCMLCNVFRPGKVDLQAFTTAYSIVD